MPRRSLPSAVLAALVLAGCHSPVLQDVDGLVCGRAGVVADPVPPSMLGPPTKPAPAPELPQSDKLPKDKEEFLKRLKVPPGVPGSDAPEIKLPRPDKTPKEVMEKAVLKAFPLQADIGPDPGPAAPGPDGRPLTLTDLQKLAREHSPLLRQAASDIKGAEGAAISAGVYPNPTLGYISSAVSFTNGSIAGPSITQPIVTMGKRKLAEAAARMDLANARLAYRRAETDLMASVRAAYFWVLVAQEGMTANRALMDLTDQLYKVMLRQLQGGEVAAYEPAQVAVYAGQARIAYMQSRNDYLQQWKNLAAALGLPLMPVTELAGSLSKGLPRFDFDKALAHVLQNHTDAQTALNGIPKARYNLRLAEVTAVPDFTIGATVLYDATPPGPPRLVPGVIASVPLPFFDRNQGGIRQAQAALVRAAEEPHRVQNALTAAFADAYRRMEQGRQILELYRKQLLPQQVQAFRAAVGRHYHGGAGELAPPGASTANLTDLIAAEQNVVSLIGTYLASLQGYWQAVSDVASLLQTDDVYAMATAVTDLPATDLVELLKLPCCHPCSSLSAPHAVPPTQGPVMLGVPTSASPSPTCALEGGTR